MIHYSIPQPHLTDREWREYLDLLRATGEGYGVAKIPQKSPDGWDIRDIGRGSLSADYLHPIHVAASPGSFFARPRVFGGIIQYDFPDYPEQLEIDMRDYWKKVRRRNILVPGHRFAAPKGPSKPATYAYDFQDQDSYFWRNGSETKWNNYQIGKRIAA